MEPEAQRSTLANGVTSNEEIYQRMLALEQELIEFQESSKELESALEEELRDLETKNNTLQEHLKIKDLKIKSLTENLADVSKDLNSMSVSYTEKLDQQERVIVELKRKLVSMEILNDDMLSQDRVQENKLLIALQFNNELLEKLALAENDLEFERSVNAQHQLTISNLTNGQETKLALSNILETPQDRRASFKVIKERNRESTYTFNDSSYADGTVLDINEMLATEPPGMITLNIPRSESFNLFKELCTKSDELRQRVGEMNSSLLLKSSSTTIVTKPDTLFDTFLATRPSSPLTDDVKSVVDSVHKKTSKLRSVVKNILR